MNYYERHIGDYLKDTAHLSLLEHGVYTRLLDVYYTRESGIPADQVARLIGARGKDEREALDAVLQEFFVLTDGAWSQDRCEREIARYQDKQAKAKRSADARWSGQRSQSEGNADASPAHDATAMRTHSEGNAPRARPQSPVSSNHTPDPKTEGEAKQPARGSRLPPAFEPDFSFARSQGVRDPEQEFEKFRDHWNAQPGQKGVKTDWPGTWRNWCRKAVEFAPRNGHHAPQETAYQRSMRERMEAAAPGHAVRNPNAKPAMEVIDVTPRALG